MRKLLIPLFCLFVITVGVLGYKASSNFKPTPIPTATPYIKNESKLFNLVNEYRASIGLNRLKINIFICDYARKRSIEIVKDYNHNGFDDDLVPPKYFAFGENLARGYLTEQDTLNAWLASPTHKVIIVGDWDEGCVAINNNDQTVFLFDKLR